jgi:hypothetical protein
MTEETGVMRRPDISDRTRGESAFTLVTCGPVPKMPRSRLNVLKCARFGYRHGHGKTTVNWPTLLKARPFHADTSISVPEPVRSVERGFGATRSRMNR